MFRDLREDEIQVRVATCKSNGVSLLLYKDARVDMNILDETFGIFGWQREHFVLDGKLYCRVSVKNPETGEWISKSDVGTESNTEEEKGQASDSFKRACFNVGIGRCLYTAPFIWVNPDGVNIIDGKKTFDKFSVSHIVIVDGCITELTVRNDTQRKDVFNWSKDGKRTAKPKPAPKAEQTVTLADVYNVGIGKGYSDNGVTGSLLKRFKVADVHDLTQAQLKEALAVMQACPVRGDQSE